MRAVGAKCPVWSPSLLALLLAHQDTQDTQDARYPCLGQPPRRPISGRARATLKATFLVPPAPRKGSLVVGGRPAAVPTEHRRRHAVPTPSCELASLAIITKVVPGWKVVCSKELRLELKSWDLATPSSHPPLTCPLYSLIATSDFFDTPDTPTVSIPRLSSL